MIMMSSLLFKVQANFLDSMYESINKSHVKNVKIINKILSRAEVAEIAESSRRADFAPCAILQIRQTLSRNVIKTLRVPSSWQTNNLL